MEETTKRIIEIDVDLGASSDRLAEVTKELDDLRKNSNELKKENTELLESVRKGEKQWSDVSKTISENSKQLADNEAKTKQLKAEQSALQGQITETTKKNRVYGDSYKELAAKLSDMKNAYRSLDKEQRESKGGKEMLAQIQQLDAEMKGADASIGNFQRNVGDYAGQIAKISGLFGSGTGAAGQFAGGIQGVTAGFKAMTGVPIIFFITALLTLFDKIKNAMMGSEAQAMKFKEALAPINPLLDAMKNGFSALADILVSVVTVAVNGLVKGLGALAKAADWVGSIFGADWGLSEKTDQMKAQMTAAQDLTKAENEYARQKRAWSVESAKIDRDVADLREKAADKEKYNAKERLAFLDEAIELETKKAARQKELAEENLRILQREAMRTENDAEMNDKLAEAERAVIEADTRLAKTKRELNSQRQEAIRQINGVTAATVSNTKAVKDNNDELAKQAEEYRKLTLTEMQKAEDALNNIIEDAFEKRRAIEETNYKRQHDALLNAMVAEEEAHGTQTELYQAYMTQWEALETQHQQNMAAIKNDEAAKEAAINKSKVEDAKKTAEAIKRIEKSRLEYSAQIAGGLSDLMEAVAGENKAMVKASKIVALAEVAIKQGVAIAEAVASSAAGDPYTYALRVAAAIASTIAAMASAISSINSVKLARGTSYVQGPGTSTSDSIPAMLSKGEGVVNARANQMFPGVVGAMNDASVGIWSPLMSMLRSSGGAPAQVASPMQMTEIQMANAFRNAVSDLDMYVSVEEINRGQRSVKVVENLGSM